jgi:hypothetical protein
MQTTKLDNRSLCLALLHADTEAEVTEILHQSGYLDSVSDWVPLGESESNFSIVENQCREPIPALVEKIVNGIEAKLISEVRRLGIDPESDAAPGSVEEAIKLVAKAPTGHLKDVSSSRRKELAEIYLVVTGGQYDPCYTITDRGEGQSPDHWADTLLSLPGNKRRSYKSRMKFVQGIFNMGGTGVLPFCGKMAYELIISRRDPSIAKPGEDAWGLTIIRKRPFISTEKALPFEYLAPNGAILAFFAAELPVLPGKYPEAYIEPLQWGTCIKLYEYKVGSYASSHSCQALYFELNRYLFEVALPVKIVERRKVSTFQQVHTHEQILSGMSERLETDRKDLIEDSSSGGITVPGLGRLPVAWYLFASPTKKNYKRESWREKKAVTLVINGQMHAWLGDQFLQGPRVDKSYLSQDLYVVVDCTPIPIPIRQELFMPSRDRLRDIDERGELIKALQLKLNDDDILIQHNERRRAEEITRRLEDKKPFEQILQQLVKLSPSLTEMLEEGQQITKLTDFEWKQKKGDYAGKRHPTFFRLEGNPKTPPEKDCPVEGSCFVHFETDAENEYFAKKRGNLSVSPSEDVLANYRLWNGIFTARLRPPAGVAVDQKIPVTLTLTDPGLPAPFQTELILKTTPKRGRSEHGDTTRTTKTLPEKNQRFKKAIEGEGEVRKGFAIPDIIPVERAQWASFEPPFTERTAVDLKPYGKQYEIFVNMDNYYLQNEVRANKKVEPALLKSQFKNSLGIIAWSMIFKAMKEPLKEGEDEDQRTQRVIESVRETSKGIAMVLLPLINHMEKISRSVSKTTRSTLESEEDATS